jgi:gamma-glutamyltranspeptidase/glutathione hydrolase
MAPSVGRRADGAGLAVGSPGADRITTALMQVLGRFCLQGDELQEAIDAPRVHVRILDDGSPRVDHEDDEALAVAIAELALPSYSHGPRSMFFGGVGAVVHSADGHLEAAGDPRREAATRVSA